MIEYLEDEARDELESSRHGQTRAHASIEVNGKRVEVFARLSHTGEVRFGYSYCGVRMERKPLLMLVCPERACPCHAVIHEKWRAFQGEAGPTWHTAPDEWKVRPLFEEVILNVGSRNCVARPALFECLTPCPHGAHRAKPMRKEGWGIFEQGAYIAGGSCQALQTGPWCLCCRPSTLPVRGWRHKARHQPDSSLTLVAPIEATNKGGHVDFQCIRQLGDVVQGQIAFASFH